MNKIRVLILGMSGNVSQGILKAIRNSGLDCYIVGACVFSDTEGLYLCDKAYTSPYAISKEFIPWLVDLCVSERIKIVFSGVEEIIDALSPVREQLCMKRELYFGRPLQINWRSAGISFSLAVGWKAMVFPPLPAACRARPKNCWSSTNIR